MPSFGNFVLDKGFRAAGALTKYRAVKLTAADTVNVVTAVGDLAIGVVQFGVTSGEILKGKGASVRMAGITQLEAAGAVAVGDLVAMAADGRAKGAAPAAGDRILGIAMEAAGGAGEYCTVFLTPTRLFVAGS